MGFGSVHVCVCVWHCLRATQQSVVPTVCVRGAARSGEIAELLNPMDDAVPRGIYTENGMMITMARILGIPTYNLVEFRTILFWNMRPDSVGVYPQTLSPYPPPPLSLSLSISLLANLNYSSLPNPAVHQNADGKIPHHLCWQVHAGENRAWDGGGGCGGTEYWRTRHSDDPQDLSFCWSCQHEYPHVT